MATTLTALNKIRQALTSAGTVTVVKAGTGEFPNTWAQNVIAPFFDVVNAIFNLSSGKIIVGSNANGINQVALSGAVTMNENGVTTLAPSGITAGTYTSLTVGLDGRATAGSNPATGSGGTISPATTTSQGSVQMSVAPVSSSTPIAVGTNDPRMTDQRTPLDGSVTTDKLADYAVSGIKLGNYVIQAHHLDDDCVLQTNIHSGSVGQNQIIDGAVVSGKIAAGAVGTAEIADGSITSAKLAAGVGGGSGGTAGVSSINAKTGTVVVTGTGGIVINATTNGFAVDGSGITGGGGGAPASTYRATVLADSPIAYWKLDEAAGATSAADESGNGHTFTVGSTVQCGVPGAITPAGTNRAMYFDGGANSYLSATVASLPQGATARSFEYWFRTQTLGDQIIMAYGANTTLQRFTSLVYQGNLVVEFTADNLPVQTQAYEMRNWHHFVYTYDGTTVKAYVDGTLIAQAAKSLNTSGSILIVGSGANSGVALNNFVGWMDEPAIYDHVLTQSQIINHYLAGRP